MRLILVFFCVAVAAIWGYYFTQSFLTAQYNPMVALPSNPSVESLSSNVATSTTESEATKASDEQVRSSSSSQNHVGDFLSKESLSTYEKIEMYGEESLNHGVTKNAAQILKKELHTIPSSKLAELLYTGQIPANIFGWFDLEVDPNDFISFQRFNTTPLAEPPNAPVTTMTQYEGMGFQFDFSEGDWRTYAIDARGRYAAVVRLSPDDEVLQGAVEQIPGFSIGTIGGEGFMVTDVTSTTTLFFESLITSTSSIPRISTTLLNSGTSSHFLFPVSVYTRGSVTLLKTETGFRLGKWNIDFDGDNITDVSVGNTASFSEQDYRIAFERIKNDAKITVAEREQIAAIEDAFITSMHPLQQTK